MTAELNEGDKIRVSISHNVAAGGGKYTLISYSAEVSLLKDEKVSHAKERAATTVMDGLCEVTEEYIEASEIHELAREGAKR